MMKSESSDLWTERLSLTICIWLCTAPFIFFVAAWFFNLGVASAAVGVSFVVILLVCNALCAFRLREFEKEKTT